jgi:hypothetical protein
MVSALIYEYTPLEKAKHEGSNKKKIAKLQRQVDEQQAEVRHALGLN